MELAARANEHERRGRRRQEELDGKGVRLKGKLAARVGKAGSKGAKELHLARMLPGTSKAPGPGNHSSGDEPGAVRDGSAGAEWTELPAGFLGDDVECEEGEEDDEEDDEDGEHGGQLASSGEKREPIYNMDGIHEKLEDFAWCAGADWLETLAVTNDDETSEHVDVNDDLARELAFYTQAAECAKIGLLKLRDRGVPVVRPKDYYAEMVKGDAHMSKVQAKLLTEHKELEEKEERRKQREAKRYSKEVQAQKQKERAMAKKADIQAVEKWRKQRKESGYGDEGGELPLGLDDKEGEGSEGGGKGRDKRNGPGNAQGRGGKAGTLRGPSKKRKFKDTKFGFGGRKKFLKKNDADSAGDMDGFRPGRGKAPGRGGKAPGRGGKAGKGSQRLGKSRRQQMRAKKK